MFNFYYYCPKCNQVIPFWKIKKKGKIYIINCCHSPYYKNRYMCLECGNQDGVISCTERINNLICTDGIESNLDLLKKIEMLNNENSQLRKMVEEVREIAFVTYKNSRRN